MRQFCRPPRGVPLMVASFGIARAQSAQNGKKVFDSLGCSRCHGGDGEGMTRAGAQGSGPPKIAQTPLSTQQFLSLVRAPKGQMPPFGDKQVSDAELLDVYAFLQSVATQPKLELPASATLREARVFTSPSVVTNAMGFWGRVPCRRVVPVSGLRKSRFRVLSPTPGTPLARCPLTRPKLFLMRSSRISTPFCSRFRKLRPRAVFRS